MKKLLNTLYVTSPDYFLGLRGENVVLLQDGKILHRIPLHALESIIAFSYSGISAALLEKCSEREVSVVILNHYGRLCGRFVSMSRGNILLRKKQAQIALNQEDSLKISRWIILAKIINARNFLIRFRKQYALRIREEVFIHAITHLKQSKERTKVASNKEELRGIEGDAQATYYGVFPHMILTNSEYFNFRGRSKRPPLDPPNALLSYAYSLLSYDCAAALEANGLDAYMGFNHTDRPGRISLALDLLEEFRVMICDRFVLRMINRGQFTEPDFLEQESGAILLTDEARKKYLSQWQKQKYESLTHPYLQEKMPWGLVPYIQAQLLARYLREDLDAYPPFFWK
ncbi:CRISPR-associated endonuclease Cas1, subtype I-C/DVULG [Aedoeadaptatus ivorii]|uniref:CRISPR-associated endonuclease Cas1 n=1 Tax=Aedoeadaptatus ivorii TaxID=54006 RepID=A0A3S5BWP4_9FIRM|nr:type I-C CRISPR-associated endonuclease Cas1c [Peptoniphilus ivorii]VEJ36338.1 CRISPR-associated endonuclease Cas1, subtype I-C/DVULG [Peptoniphilus ivorii]